MSCRVNPIRKRIVKRELKKGNNAKASMIKAGYSVNTAIKSTANKVVQVSQREIIKEFDIAEITPANIIQRIDEVVQMSIKSKDMSNALRGMEIIGKWLRMFQDSRDGSITINLGDLHAEILSKSGNKEALNRI